MFGEALWNQTVIAFTRLSRKSSDREDREKNAGKTDEKLADEYLRLVLKKLPKSRSLKYLFIDARRDKEDSTSEQLLQSSMKNLWMLLQKAPELPADRAKKAETEDLSS